MSLNLFNRWCDDDNDDDDNMIVVDLHGFDGAIVQ